MAQPSLTDEDLFATHKAYTDNDGSISGTARTLGISRRTVRYRLDEAQARLGLRWGLPLVAGQIEPTPLESRLLPPHGTVKRYVITSAQNNTHAHMPFLRNLEAFAKHHSAEILVSQYTYNKMAYGRKSVKPGRHPTLDDMADLWYDEVFDPYVCNARVELAPSLVFCGEMNIIPTAVRPLSGFETYTGRKSGIFPHAKIAMESVAAMANEGAKFNYTTGTATARNYVQKKSGLKAEHHHAYGALLIEVNSDGDWWVRQLNATEDGAFYDLDCLVKDEQVTTGHRVLALNYGDVHEVVMDETVRKLTFGAGGILDALRPAHQLMHDTFDFRARNHHEMKDQYASFKKWHEGADDVKAEFASGVEFLNAESYRPDTVTHVIDSNHDNALLRWTRDADPKYDPQNAIFYHECVLKVLYAIKEDREHGFHLVEQVCRDLGAKPDIHFLRDDESLVIAGIEFGMHGHLGIDGARGSPAALSRMGRKANTGHTHKAQIIDGLYVAGTCSRMRLSYNKGPSSWSHSHVVTYPNGKRTIVTIWNGKWRA